jgi:hypothetical protein
VAKGPPIQAAAPAPAPGAVPTTKSRGLFGRNKKRG